jgi:hypothetical protein
LIGKSGNVSLFDLDFTLPGFSAIELVPNGANVKVTDDNFQEYLDLVIEKVYMFVFNVVNRIRSRSSNQCF